MSEPSEPRPEHIERVAKTERGCANYARYALDLEARLLERDMQLEASRKIRAYVAFVLTGDEKADVQLAADRIMTRLEAAERERDQAREVVAELDGVADELTTLRADYDARLAEPCKVCGGDPKVAEIGEALGFRPDIQAREIMRLRERLEAAEQEISNLETVTCCHQDKMLELNDEGCVCPMQRERDEVQRKLKKIAAQSGDGCVLDWPEQVALIHRLATERAGEGVGDE